MRRLVIILIMLASSFPGKAQQDPAISQYAFNGLSLNPAYAGSHPYMSATVLSRTQWVSFPGAPKTNFFSVDGAIRDMDMGLGLIAMHDKIGVSSNTELYGVYSYHIQTTKDAKLSFGLKAGFANYKENFNELITWDEDHVFDRNAESRWLPKFGFGLYYYAKDYYVGLSIPTLLAYDKHYSFSLDLEKSSFYRRHFYLTGGYVFPLNKQVKLKPFSMIKYVPGAPVQADLNLSAIYLDKYVLGLGYRSSGSMTALVEFKWNDMFRLGYAYDFLHSDLYRYEGGTHEILLGFDFGGNVRKVKNVRYF